MKLYGRDEGRDGDAVDNLLDAIPRDRYLSTVQIWHASAYPKLPYGAVIKILRRLVEDGLIGRVGGERGAQFYRWDVFDAEAVAEAMRKRSE